MAVGEGLRIEMRGFQCLAVVPDFGNPAGKRCRMTQYEAALVRNDAACYGPKTKRVSGHQPSSPLLRLVASVWDT